MELFFSSLITGAIELVLTTVILHVLHIYIMMYG